MAIFVYVTDRCQEDARTHGQADDIERLRERVEATQSTSSFDPFPSPYLVKKKLGGRQGRLIADFRSVGEHGVVVFLATLIRGHRDYSEFADDARGYGDAHFSRLVSPEELERYVQERTRIAPAPEKPTPTDDEYGLLYGAFAHHADVGSDMLVCETAQWTEAVAQDRVANQLALLARPCLNALQGERGLHFYPVDGKQGWGIWALKQEERLLLIAPSTEATAKSVEEYARQIGRDLENSDAAQVLRASRRAYPSIILADDDLWIDLEKAPVANLALSPEESEVLESARKGDHPFPLFINGRAGSGKSTILQYLFADLLFNYLTRGQSGSVAPPIYLTANAELLRVARSFVERLLRSEATFSHQAEDVADGDLETVLSDSFKEFYAYVLSRVPPAVRKYSFARGNRVDYSRFRFLWHEKFGRDPQAVRLFGPDLSWHVIRSYIKGMGAETYLEPEDYESLPENQLTVTFDTYRTVYDRVWKGWYEEIQADAGLWDDQDLARYVLDEDLAQPTYPAVFCDEAQDFTRLELELLLRINLFSDRLLSPNDLGRVCFAFAGDQFQTLNPTGFRWDSIKATFVEKFIFAIDPGRRVGRADLNYRELQYNYRSSDKIVRFGNHVQAMRAALFGMPDVKPQRPWTTERSSFPVIWFRSNDAAFWGKYRENGSFVVIVPCAEGEEAAYVKGDPVLREHVSFADGVPLNVLSASRAKGCEYPAVIVYGFGEAVGEDVVARVTEGEAVDRDPGRDLPLQYFVNRLYVAVSRAKRRLIVVDSDHGLERLWQFAQDGAVESKMLAAIRRGKELWSDHIQGMTEGRPEEVVRDRAADPLENARAYEADGLARRDFYSMRQAAQAYRSANDPAKARECTARALEFEGRYLDAGQAYLEAGFVNPDAIRCLWMAGQPGWRQLVVAQRDHPVVTSELEFECARLVLEEPKASLTISFLNRLVARLSDPAFADACAGSSVWRDALGALLSRPLAERGHGFEMADWQQIAIQLDHLEQSALRPPQEEAAAAYFAAGRYGEAIRHWDEAGNTRDARYAKAKAFVEPYPRNVAALGSLKFWKDIVEGYGAHRDMPLNADQAGWVTSALCQEGQLDNALAVASSAGRPESLLQVALAARQADPTLAELALHRGFANLVSSRKWDLLVSYLAGTDFRPTQEWGDPDAEGWLQACRGRLDVTLVRAFARQGDLESAPEVVQRRWSAFLKKFVRDMDGGWQEQVTVEEAGAAIERTGRYSDGIWYYETLKRNAGSANDQEFAKRRLLVCRDRQLQHEKAQRETGRTRQIERELKQAMAKMQVPTIQSLGVYPELGPLELPDSMPEAARPEPDKVAGAAVAAGSAPQLKKSLKAAMGLPDELSAGPEGAYPETAVRPIETPEQCQESKTGSRPDRLRVTVGVYELQMLRSTGRLNITNTETLETAHLRVENRELAGEGDFVERGKADWWSDKWGLRVAVVEKDEAVTVAIASGIGVGIRIDT